MNTVFAKGVIRSGRVEVAEPIDLPDGSEVAITGYANQEFSGCGDNDRPMLPEEIAATLAAMEKIEPFDMTDADRNAADTWEKQINDYAIANLNKGIEDVFR